MCIFKCNHGFTWIQMTLFNHLKVYDDGIPSNIGNKGRGNWKCHPWCTLYSSRKDHWNVFFLWYNFFFSLVCLPTTQITFLQSPSMEPPVLPGPDNVVSAANLSCTVANEGSFQWQWIPPPGIALSQMWVADGTRTSIVQIFQISAANAGIYTCQASFNGQSANTSIAIQLNRKWITLL